MGVCKYRDGILMAVHSQGVFYFNGKNKSIDFFTKNINEAFNNHNPFGKRFNNILSKLALSIFNRPW